MRSSITLSIAAVLGLAALGVASNAYGQSPSAPEQASVRISASLPTYRLDASHFDDVRGTYLLSNGQRLTLSTEGKRYYALIDGQPRTEIVPVRHDTFVARGSGMRLEFDQFDGKRRHDVVLTIAGADRFDRFDRVGAR